MSADSLLPARINKLHSRFNTPYISIIICSVIVSFMIMWTFGELLVIDITIYTAGLSLEYLSLIKLRRSRPDMIRPFKIPFNVTGLCFILVLPAMVYLVALSDSLSSSKDASKPVLFALAALATAELAWQILRFSIRKKNGAY
jgi:amino acid transporter